MTDILLSLDDDRSLMMIKNWENEKVVAGMTTRHGGVSEPPYHSLNVGFHVGDRYEHVLTNRQLVAEKLQFPIQRWVLGEQTHGNRVFKVEMEDIGKGALSLDSAVKDVDGLYTKEKGILLAALFADCVPLYFFARKHHLIGIAHAGWKGTVNNIAGRMVEVWKKEGIEPGDIEVIIGPSINQCCYEVDERVISEVRKLSLNDRQIFRQHQQGKYMLNLKLANKLLLMRFGVHETNIIESSTCTSCSNSTFFSHRKERGKTGRMMAFIGLRQPG